MDSLYPWHAARHNQPMTALAEDALVPADRWNHDGQEVQLLDPLTSRLYHDGRWSVIQPY